MKRTTAVILSPSAPRRGSLPREALRDPRISPIRGLFYAHALLCCSLGERISVRSEPRTRLGPHANPLTLSRLHLDALEQVAHLDPQSQRDAIQGLDGRRVLAQLDLRQVAQ